MTYTLITGASSGIGKQLAILFAKASHNIILVARSESKLNELKISLEKQYGISAVVITTDLSQSNAAEMIYRATSEKGLIIDNLINNAGFGDCTEFVESTSTQNMLAVNITVLAELTRLYGQDMKKHGKGHILNIASVAAFFPGPYMACYYASKAFVLSFSQAVHEELKPYGVSVSTICLGPADTGFETAANLKNARMFKLFKAKSPEDVAKCAYRAMQKGKPVTYFSSQAKFLNFLSRITPYAISRRFTKIVNS